MELEIALIRHGQASDKAKFLGMTDEPLNENGARLIRENKAAGLYPEASLVFSSGLARCVETAKIIYPSVPAVIAKDLRAPDYGEFECKEFEELVNDKSFENWADSPGLAACPGGESPYEMLARSAMGFRKICDEAAAKGLNNISIITHRIIIQAILQRYCVPRSSYVDREILAGGGYFLKYDTLASTVNIISKF